MGRCEGEGEGRREEREEKRNGEKRQEVDRVGKKNRENQTKE